ncbi:transport and Golgi organization protein 1 homolog isoform X1 [Pleuronectes platessa]|uniref:transport and Golgi organization protein 1 homolog isoform X1 n=1 Tax=Pleuronectes platessa TaxID=8262 RepID=UPI00232A6598|nr:transport and Golgi organization protein 1 homolog isoform X1 [Pleuronectes platessa]
MAAKHFYRQGFLLLLFNFISTAALEKRFSDLKRCADEECSMLLCRGKALRDFSPPDCRFLSFKKSETIYVYYKLAGRRTDMWAGSVGNMFGYFPKDLLAVNHLYTDKEVELPAEETDFVCFDNGFDKFDNYDIDVLLASLVEENSSESRGTSDQIQEAEDTPKETQPYEDEEEGEEEEQTEKQTEQQENVDLLDPDDQKASLSELDVENELPPIEVEFDTAVTPDFIETAVEVEQVKLNESVLDNVVSERSEPKDTLPNPEVESVAKDELVPETESVSVTEGTQIPELKTTLGSTFDAIVTGEEITKRVTPYEEEEENQEVDDNSKENVDVIKDTPLLSFTEKAMNTPAPDSLQEHEAPPVTHKDEPQAAEEKNMWTSLGDAVFSVVTGGEMTAQDVNSDEDDDEEDDEEEEEAAAKPTEDFEETKKDVEEPLIKESPKEPEIIEQVLLDPPGSSSVQTDKETINDPEELLLDSDDEGEVEVIEHEEEKDETLKPSADAPQTRHPTGAKKLSDILLSQRDTSANNGIEKSEIKTTDQTIKHKEEKVQEVSKDSGVIEDVQDSSIAMENRLDLDNVPEENKTEDDRVFVSKETETHQILPNEESRDLELEDNIKPADDSLPDRMHEDLLADLKKHIRLLDVSEPEIHEEPHTKELEEEIPAELEEEIVVVKEELLEDENALPYDQSDNTDSDKPALEPETRATASTVEPVYSDSVMRLTLLRERFSEKYMARFQKLLGLKNLFKVEAMFSDLDTELQATRRSDSDTTQDIESALEEILEASETTILDEIEKMLDAQNAKNVQDPHEDTSSEDEETEILDDFQELAFSLRQKYSTASDSTPLAADMDQDGHELNVTEETLHIVQEEKVDIVPEAEREQENITVTDREERAVETEEEKVDIVPEAEREQENITVTDREERAVETEVEQIVLDEVNSGPDVSVEEDGGHSNKNKDNQPGFSSSEDMQKVPEATLETPLDVGVGVEVEPSPPGSLEPLDPVSEINEAEVGLFSTGLFYTGCIFSIASSKIVEWTTVMISLLPDEWKPGETLYGCPWQAVVFTALVGVVSFTIFFWRTVLAVKNREYLVDEKRLTEQIQALKKEKDDSLAKMSELQKQTENLKEHQKQSKETVGSTMKRIQQLESKVLEAESRNKRMADENYSYVKQLEEERTHSKEYETRIEKLEKSNEKLQLSRKKIQETLSRTSVLLDEAKIREDARKVQHQCLGKDYAALKEENKTCKMTIKSWEDKHKELSEQIKSYQKSQKELEDSVVLKDHNVEVLSELLADLDACELQKGETKVLANGEIASDKKTIVKNRIKQMMDVSRVQTTLTVVEEERDRFMTKLLNEETMRKSLEEQHQELEHSIATLKSDKSHVENQFKILQQKNEIMVEMYQQKENALQQKLTKEELERRSKENMLSEVGGKAVEAEEQVKVLRHRINEMEDQMKKTEDVYKEQIKEQENKTHSNWVNARNAERALSQEKLESSKLREKLAVLSSQLNERRAPLFRPNPGQAAVPRQGDSYGPSPVSGGAPSPPIMIEGPRRPPSAPVGRRIDPYGSRPPSDPHGRYSEHKHGSGMDLMGPRSSSPSNMDGPTQAVDPQVKAETQAEASTESPEPGPGSFIASPIRDSPGPMIQGHPPGPGPHDPLHPPGPHIRLPPPGPYRHPRPGPYHLPPGPLPPNLPPLHGPPLPANGHPGMPGPMGGDFGPRPANGHAFHPRPGPGHLMDPRGPLPPHFRPPPPHHFGPMPPPHGVRGPIGPRPPFHPDMRFPGPRDHINPPMDLPPGVQPHPAHPGDAFRQAPPHALHNSAGAPSGPGLDPRVRPEAPQDSARPAMAQP